MHRRDFLRLAMSSAAASYQGDKSGIACSSSNLIIPRSCLLPAIFMAAEQGNRFESIKPEDVERHIPALVEHRGEDIHGAVALGSVATLLCEFQCKKTIVTHLLDRMRGDTKGEEFREQYHFITQDLWSFLDLAGNTKLPAMILLSSHHISSESSHKVTKQNPRIEYVDHKTLGSSDEPSRLVFPSLGKSMRIAGDSSRFEPTPVGGVLTWVKRKLAMPSPREVSYFLTTQAVGFVPEPGSEAGFIATMARGHWHKAGRDDDRTVIDSQGAALFTRHPTLDAWIFSPRDRENFVVMCSHLHMALSPRGKLYDIDGTERFATSYLDMNGMFRSAVENSVHGQAQ